jgi:sigma-B regulation protein RsbU (phosphoserine phosphatase)
VIGDVSGKSIPAALYGAVFSGQLQTLFANRMKPEEKLTLLNNSLISRYPAQNYIAVACLDLDIAQGSGSIASAGMPFPYLVRAGEVSQLKAPGVPLGLLQDSAYDAHTFRLETGDTLILTSDGALDAMDADEGIYDPERFLESIRRHCSRDIAGFVSGLYADIIEFTGSAEVYDDITILALRKLS